MHMSCALESADTESSSPSWAPAAHAAYNPECKPYVMYFHIMQALWLGVEPADLLLYVFLPPILLDSAARIDFFVFKKARPARQIDAEITHASLHNCHA